MNVIVRSSQSGGIKLFTNVMMEFELFKILNVLLVF